MFATIKEFLRARLVAAVLDGVGQGLMDVSSTLDIHAGELAQLYKAEAAKAPGNGEEG